jgi:hypothetical protein
MAVIQPLTQETAGPAAPILESVQQQMGGVPNIFATMAQSPAVLEGFLAFNHVEQADIDFPLVATN